MVDCPLALGDLNIGHMGSLMVVVLQTCLPDADIDSDVLTHHRKPAYFAVGPVNWAVSVDVVVVLNLYDLDRRRVRRNCHPVAHHMDYLADLEGPEQRGQQL